jgi:tetratricopeptide (TPR) repeat protein
MYRIVLAALLGAAVGFSATSVRADQDDPRLAELFAKLQRAPSPSEASAAEVSIWQIWTETADDETEKLMQHGIAALGADDEEEALDAFNAVVQRDEHFAEGWNKRATVEFVMGDYDASVADIERTLALEPRHFGALSGLGQIYLALDRKRAALKAFRAALAINPHLDGVREKIEELKKTMDGDPI